jgi:ribosomal protein S12 methylthiotransferase accessory factor YcaO
MEFIGEMGAGFRPHLPRAIESAVDELAQRTLEEYVEGMTEYEADREYHTRKEMDE